jgi:hypothetical protein
MAGIGQLIRVYELIAKPTGELDESASVNVLIVERATRSRTGGEPHVDLAERLELQLLSKAQGETKRQPRCPRRPRGFSQWAGGGVVKLGDIDLNLGRR